MGQPERPQTSSFVSFAEQQGHTKLHTISLSIEFPPRPAIQETLAPCCNSPLASTLIEYKFGWGDTERLQCTVPGTPALRCSCGLSVVDDILQLIKDQGRCILKAIESQNDSDFAALSAFLNSDDLAKVRDFAINRRVPNRLNGRGHTTPAAG